MKLPIRDWQGCSSSWQTAFIRENFLPLGYAAWQGYLSEGRGIVACDMEVGDATTIDWSGDVVRYSLQYIPAIAVPIYLQPCRLPANFIHRLMDTLQTYSPIQEILISISKDEQIEIDWLRNLAIAPPDCYRQVCNRWDEFDLGTGLSGRHDDAQS
ncbi:MAG: hypothetical protein VKL39_18440 [Leptolyngbyaceae bacterium]|nr:hypothetical protein [Leptolyngbyaceae bacterium]